MYIFSNTLKQILKIFAISIVCSALFTGIINIEAVFSKPAICFVLLIASMTLFAYICFHNFTRLYYDSDYVLEYAVPACLAYAIYICAAAILYSFRLSSIYNWFFLPTRFLEPVLSNEKFSFLAAHSIIALIIILVPVKEGGFSSSY